MLAAAAVAAAIRAHDMFYRWKPGGAGAGAGAGLGATER